jgi:hypothetical protein
MWADRYSIVSVLAQALRGQQGWKPVWRKPSPKASSMMSSSSAAAGTGCRRPTTSPSQFGITNVAVLEKGYLGSGNVGRNTTAVRSNYLLPQNHALYEHSMKMWENLEQDINYNAMVSQRGVLNLFHTTGQRDASPGAAMPCGCTASMPSC